MADQQDDVGMDLTGRARGEFTEEIDWDQMSEVDPEVDDLCLGDTSHARSGAAHPAQPLPEVPKRLGKISYENSKKNDPSRIGSLKRLALDAPGPGSTRELQEGPGPSSTPETQEPALAGGSISILRRRKASGGELPGNPCAAGPAEAPDAAEPPLARALSEPAPHTTLQVAAHLQRMREGVRSFIKGQGHEEPPAPPGSFGVIPCAPGASASGSTTGLPPIPDDAVRPWRSPTNAGASTRFQRRRRSVF